MSADAILEEFKSLPPAEQRRVFEQITLLLRETASPDRGADPIRSARGMFAGSNLTAALLARRVEERRRG